MTELRHWTELLGEYTPPEEPETPSFTTVRAPKAPPTGAAIDAGDLRRALKIVRPACGTSSAITALGGVLVEVDGQAGTVTCDSMDVACQASVAAAGKIKTLVSLTALEGVVADLVGAITFTVEADETVIGFEDTIVRLRTLRLEDFPAEQTFDGTLILTAGEELAEAIVASAVSASRDEVRPTLRGVCLDGARGTICTTDSFRMFIADMVGERTDAFKTQQLLADAAGLAKAVKGADALTLKLTSTARQSLIVARADRTWRVALIDGQFPDYEKLLPSEFTYSIVFKRADAVRVLARTLKVLRDTTIPTRLTSRKLELAVELELLTEKPDVGAVCAVLPAQGGFEGGEREPVGLSARYLLEGLGSCGSSEQIELRCVSPLRPLLLVDGHVRYLLMPIRLPWRSAAW